MEKIQKYLSNKLYFYASKWHAFVNLNVLWGKMLPEYWLDHVLYDAWLLYN